MKWLLAYIYTWAKKKDIKPVFNFNHKSSDLAEIGVVSLEESCIRENPRQLTSDYDAADTVGFSGVHQDGSCLIARISRRHGRVAEVMLYLCLSNGDEYVLPLHPDTHICNTDDSSFSAGGLGFEVLEPLRRWRVYFNGYLRKVNPSSTGSSTGSTDTVRVRFNFLWHPIYCYMTFPQDFSIGCLAEQLSRKNLSEFLPPWKLFPEEWHEQFGELHGIINIENLSEIEMFIRGLKIRKHGVNCWKNVINKISIQGYLQNGTAFHIFVENTKEGVENFVYGYVCSPCMMFVEHIIKCDFNFEMLCSIKQELNDLDIHFTADKRKYDLQIKGKDLGFLTNSGKDWNCQSYVKQLSVMLNGKPGHGVFECVYQSSQLRPSAVKESMVALKEMTYIGMSDNLVVSYQDEECKCSRIVGGKGASLALMAGMSGNIQKLFVVPDGVCVTNTAFMQHISDHSHLRDAIHGIEKLAWKVIDGDLQSECDSLVSLMAATTLSTSLMNVLKRKLSDVFGADYEGIRFAVRSSAIGEDGDEMSAAGQNETYLGIEKFDEICIAIQKCWASQFSYRSIEYKRQNGQTFSEGMGVVIQKMVAADASGVLFTKDPLTGNMSIASNYGLGESVVSAAVDPDMINLQRSWDNELKIAEKTIGNKTIMITMHDKFGTTESEVKENDAMQCSISDELAIRLGEIGIFLENAFGKPRDIEWAVKDDKIYILQSRPIIMDGLMTDFEIIHEFDTAMRSDSEHYTTANVGEVMPGAQSPLTLAPLLSQVPFMQSYFSWRILLSRFDPTVIEMFGNFYGHVISDRLQMKALSLSEEKSSVSKALEVAFFGRVLDDDRATKMALERYEIKPPKSFKMKMGLLFLKAMFGPHSQLKKTTKKFKNEPDPTLGCTSARQAYINISKKLSDITEVMYIHGLVSMASSVWNLLTLNLLSKGTGEFTTVQYADFALLVGSCNGAESGDVPFSLQELANTIAKEINPEKFREMPPKDAYTWLQENTTEAGKLFKDFLERHGHRGLQEFDLSCTSWGMDPTELIKVLQNMLKYPIKEDKQKDDVNIIDKISTPLSPIKKRMLSFVMKRCRTGVCYREQSKSSVIKYYDILRLGYRSLAQLMMKEGLLPDPSLIFFFTHEEIDLLIRTRSPKILRRVKHRARLHPYMERLSFEEMIEGYPIPIEEQERVYTGETVEVKGYPVSQGKIEGPARVVTSFQDVNTIQPGEILITVGTDIGWSPYFPILAGVVTELGGLISHGAVVAREFGLPCIVGARNATRIFKSGDIVLLNATTGVLTKVG